MEQWAVTLQRALSQELPRGWRESAPWGYPQQSELAVIAGVFAAQLPERTAEEVAANYMMARPGRMLNALDDLAAISVEELAAMLGSQWGASQVLGVPRMRAAVIVEVAGALAGLDIRTAEQYRVAMRERGDAVDRVLQLIRGLGVVTAESISAMMQAEHHPDADVVAHVHQVLGYESSGIHVDEVVELLRLTARRLTVEPRVLNYALWRLVEERQLEKAAEQGTAPEPTPAGLEDAVNSPSE